MSLRKITTFPSITKGREINSGIIQKNQSFVKRLTQTNFAIRQHFG
jgi:hypothetical protein